MHLNHYTDAVGLDGIVKDEGLIFRATRYSHLSDSMEYKWIRNKINPQKEELYKEFDLILDTESNTHPYVICFCDLEDELVMWELYGNKSKGFMITLDYEIVAHFALNPNGDYTNPDVFQGISYANDIDCLTKFRSAYAIYKKDYGSNSSIDLDEVAALIKRDIYAHENETRYIRLSRDISSFKYVNGKGLLSYSGEDYSRIKFKSNQNGFTPFMEVRLPKEALRSITIGPNTDYERQKCALELLLLQRGYKNVNIIKSEIIK